MKENVTIASVLTVIAVALFLAMEVVAAQTPPVAPKPDAFVVGYAQAVAGWQSAAAQACQQLDAMKTYQQVLANATKEVEAHVPGYTMNWATGTLVPKAAPK